MSEITPSYLSLLYNGTFEQRIARARTYLQNCGSCPQQCGVNRYNGELGKCYSSHLPIVSSFTAHFGEEPIISGTRGAGNIFFGNCNLRCVYCQNHEISQNRAKERLFEVSIERLAAIMIELQEQGCHNIGLVSPTHFAVPILESIYLAAKAGLCIPIVYNTNAYDNPEILELFDGIVDIYLPDLKYGCNESGYELSNAPNYFNHAKLAIAEMFRQTGDRLVVHDNILQRGLIIRHLILPNGFAETEEVCRFIAEALSPNIHISIMSQYYPVFKAEKNILLSRGIRESEYNSAIRLLEKYGLQNGWIQDFSSQSNYRPHFEQSRSNPFLNDI